MDRKNISFAFKKHEPSLFIIGSPFQLLCAMEAIHEFEIDDFEFVLTLYPDNTRNGQLINMINDLGYQYKRIDASSLTFKNFILQKKWVKTCRKYHRVFIGEYMCYEKRYLAARVAKNKAAIVFLDDGNSSIALFDSGNQHKRCFLSNSLLTKQGIKHTIFDTYGACRGLLLNKYFYSIYHDIPNDGFIVYPNSLSHLISQSDAKVQDQVLVVGTVSEHFCRQMGISESVFENILQKRLEKLRNENQSSHITYIPHGRDVNLNIPHICSQLSIEYRKISSALEHYMIKNHIYPKMIFGINSTALLTMKKILPRTEVVNMRIDYQDAPYYNFFKMVADYYSRNGIEIETIPFKK